MTPSVPTEHTLAFARAFLPAPPASLLEVGAGAGELAWALVRAGYDVTAIEIDAAAVTAMHAAGLAARNVSWLDYDGPAVDAILFSRSLHHLHLPAAVHHAIALLKPGGRVLVEDFAFADMPPAVTSWLRDQLADAAQNPGWRPPAAGFLADLLAGSAVAGPHAAEREIASADTMRALLASSGNMIHETQMPYFYRYFAPQLNDSNAATVLRRILAAESQAISAGTLWPLGRRWVIEIHP